MIHHTKMTIPSDLQQYLLQQPDKKARFTIEQVNPDSIKVKEQNKLEKPNKNDFYEPDWEDKEGGSFYFAEQEFDEAMNEWKEAEQSRRTFLIPIGGVNVEELAKGVDFKKMALKKYPEEICGENGFPIKIGEDFNGYDRKIYLDGLKKGYNHHAATHKFSEDDLRAAWSKGTEQGFLIGRGNESKKLTFEEYLSSLETKYKVGDTVEIIIEDGVAKLFQPN